MFQNTGGYPAKRSHHSAQQDRTPPARLITKVQVLATTFPFKNDPLPKRGGPGGRGYMDGVSHEKYPNKWVVQHCGFTYDSRYPK